MKNIIKIVLAGLLISTQSFAAPSVDELSNQVLFELSQYKGQEPLNQVLEASIANHSLTGEQRKQVATATLTKMGLSQTQITNLFELKDSGDLNVASVSAIVPSGNGYYITDIAVMWIVGGAVAIVAIISL